MEVGVQTNTVGFAFPTGLPYSDVMVCLLLFAWNLQQIPIHTTSMSDGSNRQKSRAKKQKQQQKKPS